MASRERLAEFKAQLAQCEHTATSRSKLFAFVGPVVTHPESQNKPAHGGVTYSEHCKACGRARDVNQNGRHFEYGPWKRL